MRLQPAVGSCVNCESTRTRNHLTARYSNFMILAIKQTYPIHMQNHEACPDTSFDITLW